MVGGDRVDAGAQVADGLFVAREGQRDSLDAADLLEGPEVMLEPAERRDRAGRLVRGDPGKDVVGREEHVVHLEADLPRAVTGDVVDDVAVDDPVPVAQDPVQLHGLEEVLGEPVHLLQLLPGLGLEPRALHEDPEILGGQDDALLEVVEHPGVQLVDEDVRVGLAREIGHEAEVVDVRVADHDVLHGGEVHPLAEALPDLGEPPRQILHRLGRARPHVEERGVVAVEDQIDVVHVERKGLNGELVDPDPGASLVPTDAGLDAHAFSIPWRSPRMGGRHFMWRGSHPSSGATR